MTRCAAFAMLMAITTACAGETRSADDAATATREAGADTVVGPPADPGSITGRGAAADTVPIDSLPTVRAREVEAEARQRGVDFRGVGQEPGWIVEIDDGVSIVFNGDYGETRATAPAPAPDVEQATGRAVYRARAADGELIVMIEPTTCRDAMSGASYEAAVVLHYAGREYRGCGQYLR